jgi:hypothetical protein
MAFPLSPWTDELVQKVKHLWPTNTARDIVKIIARDHHLCFTRNAIIGKMKREGLLKADEPKPVKEKPQRVSTRKFTPKSRAEQPQALFLPRLVHSKPRNLTLYELENGDCRYPTDSENPAEMLFCGNPCVEGCSYCGIHKQLCYVPAKPPSSTFREKRAVA